MKVLCPLSIISGEFTPCYDGKNVQAQCALLIKNSNGYSCALSTHFTPRDMDYSILSWNFKKENYHDA